MAERYRKVNTTALAVLCSAVPFAGCQAPSDPGIAAIGAQLTELKKAVADIKKQNDQLKFQVSNLKRVVDGKADSATSATFDPAENAFQRLDTSTGSFAVSMQDVSTFADGLKLRLNLGNLSTATFHDVKLTVKYGPREPEMVDDKFQEWLEASSKWEKALKVKTIDLTQQLRPGSWNPTTIILPNMKETEFGYAEISMKGNTISLAAK